MMLLKILLAYSFVVTYMAYSARKAVLRHQGKNVVKVNFLDDLGLTGELSENRLKLNEIGLTSPDNNAWEIFASYWFAFFAFVNIFQQL